METRFFATGNYRKDGRTETAHAMKEGANWAIYKAAAEMVKYIPTNAVLVPMPSHTGRATYTLELCKRIARETAAEVCDYLRGKERETTRAANLLRSKTVYYQERSIFDNIAIVDGLHDQRHGQSDLRRHRFQRYQDRHCEVLRLQPDRGHQPDP